MPTIEQLAATAYGHMEHVIYDDEYWRRSEGSPEWVEDLCREAHGDMWPDYHRYFFIVEALAAIAEGYETMPDEPYTSNLTRWLDSSDHRVSYLTEVLETYEPRDGFTALAQAYALEQEEVYGAVYGFLENLAEEEEKGNG